MFLVHQILYDLSFSPFPHMFVLQSQFLLVHGFTKISHIKMTSLWRHWNVVGKEVTIPKEPYFRWVNYDNLYIHWPLKSTIQSQSPCKSSGFSWSKHHLASCCGSHVASRCSVGTRSLGSRRHPLRTKKSQEIVEVDQVDHHFFPNGMNSSSSWSSIFRDWLG